MKLLFLSCLSIMLFFSCASTPEKKTDSGINSELDSPVAISDETPSSEEDKAETDNPPETGQGAFSDIPIKDTRMEPTVEIAALPELWAIIDEKPILPPDPSDDEIPLFEPAVIWPILEPPPAPSMEPVFAEIEEQPILKSELQKSPEEAQEEVPQEEEPETVLSAVETETAETEDSGAVEREPVPLPVTPIPEPPARTIPTPIEPPLEFSRKVRATVGQLVEIPFTGSGWVYLGELGSRKGLPYDSRRLDKEGQTFIFRAETPGDFSLKFFKQDFIKDLILNDHVQVTIGEAPLSSSVGGFTIPIDRGRIIALPRWPAKDDSQPIATVVSEKSTEVPSETTTDAVTATKAAMPQTASASSTTLNQEFSQGDEGISAVGPAKLLSQGSAKILPEDYLKLARTEYDRDAFQSALDALNFFTELYPGGSDEAWWLYGCVYEATGPLRDIKSALAYYKRLINEYPHSSRYGDAQKRIAYLERYYFNLR